MADDGVRFVGDIAFADVVNSSGDMERLHLDLYLPDGGQPGRRPAIIWFHGGGFRPGNNRRQVYIPMFAKAFAARGFAGIAPDYRLRADTHSDAAGTVGDAVADGRRALTWVHSHGEQYGFDRQRLVLAGGSAGGMLALNLCHDAQQPIESESDGVRAVFDMWGTPGGDLRLFARAHAGSPPTLIIHGTADKLVPYENSVRFAEELAGLGVAHRLLTLPDAPHTPLKHFEQIVAEMEAFLAQYVSGAHPDSAATRAAALAAEFDARMRLTYQEGVKRGYYPTYFLRMVNEQGGVQTAKSLLAKQGAQTGLFRLYELGLLHDSAEAHVIDPYFRALFTIAEIAEARRRLDALGYTPVKR